MSKQKTISVAKEVKTQLSKSSLWATIGAGISAVIVIVIYFTFERFFQDVAAFRLIQSMRGTTNTFCFAGITSSATILPLMLTIFSLARGADHDFGGEFHTRVKHISLLCVLTFIAGLYTLMILSAPLGESFNVSNMWYRVLYYAVIGGLAAMVSFLVATLMMLYGAITFLVEKLSPHLSARDVF